MYKLAIPPKELKKLFLLREYCGGGPIARQVRSAVENFILEQEKKIGTSIEDATEGIHRHSIDVSQSCLLGQD